MRLFGLGGKDETPEARARREASEENLARGGLPLNAIDRLKEQASRQGKPGHIFTSDLSVNELALTHEAGYLPLGQVMGSSIYQIGWQYMPSGGLWYQSSGELTVMTEAYYNARHLALGRLKQEAALLGASGVIGVRLEVTSKDLGSSLLEFIAIGTAIREIAPRDGVTGEASQSRSFDAKPGAAEPFLSDLSGSEFWLLRQSGFRPVGIALGNCTWYQIAGWQTQSATSGFWGSGWANQELTDYTQGVYNARALAMSRMEAEALAVGASGIVGADVEMNIETRDVDLGNERHRRDLICHFNAFGTAIAPIAGHVISIAPANTVSLGW